MGETEGKDGGKREGGKKARKGELTDKEGRAERRRRQIKIREKREKTKKVR